MANKTPLQTTPSHNVSVLDIISAAEVSSENNATHYSATAQDTGPESSSPAAIPRPGTPMPGETRGSDAESMFAAAQEDWAPGLKGNSNNEKWETIYTKYTEGAVKETKTRVDSNIKTLVDYAADIYKETYKEHLESIRGDEKAIEKELALMRREQQETEDNKNRDWGWSTRPLPQPPLSRESTPSLENNIDQEPTSSAVRRPASD